VRVGQRPVQFFDELQAALQANAGKPTVLTITRGGEPLTLTVK
jgi:regulator of sigma E protease